MNESEIKWRNNNRDKYNEYQRKWYSENYEKRRLTNKTNHNNRKNKLFEILGDKCINCGFSDKRALQIDHINGGGNKERLQHSNKLPYVFYVKNPEIAKDKLQILCANCNWIKRHKNKEYTKNRKYGLDETS